VPTGTQVQCAAHTTVVQHPARTCNTRATTSSAQCSRHNVSGCSHPKQQSPCINMLFLLSSQHRVWCTGIRHTLHTPCCSLAELIVVVVTTTTTRHNNTVQPTLTSSMPQQGMFSTLGCPAPQWFASQMLTMTASTGHWHGDGQQQRSCPAAALWPTSTESCPHCWLGSPNCDQGM